MISKFCLLPVQLCQLRLLVSTHHNDASPGTSCLHAWPLPASNALRITSCRFKMQACDSCEAMSTPGTGHQSRHAEISSVKSSPGYWAESWHARLCSAAKMPAEVAIWHLPCMRGQPCMHISCAMLSASVVIVQRPFEPSYSSRMQDAALADPTQASSSSARPTHREAHPASVKEPMAASMFHGFRLCTPCARKAESRKER